MDKQTAIRLLGGSVAEVAKWVRVTPQAVSQWKETLSPRIADRIEAAIARKEAAEKPVGESV